MHSSHPQKKLGTLYIVATPIGNLQDITFRAVETLKSVNKIAAEDTRHAAQLLKHFSIEKPIISLHEHNEVARTQMIIDYLLAGDSIALISDAGTPLINDPGYRLVRTVRQQKLSVIPIPGPCAAITAICAAGLPTDRFLFAGFLSAKGGECEKQLEALKEESCTLIFYETPHRLIKVLTLMIKVFGSTREIAVAKELTKIHENYVVGTLQNALDYFQENSSKVRGEFVLCVAGIEEKKSNTEHSPEKVLEILLTELPLKQAAQLASQITGARKNDLYQLGLQKK